MARVEHRYVLLSSPHIAILVADLLCAAMTGGSQHTVGLVATDEIGTEFAQRAAAAGHALRVCAGPGAPDGMPHSKPPRAAYTITHQHWPNDRSQTCSLLRACSRSIRSQH